MAKSNKKLDKNLMFSKIMPALADNPFSADAAALDSANSPEHDSLSDLREKIYARSNELSEPESVAVINIMENLVYDNVDVVMQRFNACSCDRCRSDICAYALNHLPAHYVVAPSNKTLQHEAEVSEKAVLDALVKAVIQVRAHPHH